jgi:hypothetical protein
VGDSLWFVPGLKGKCMVRRGDDTSGTTSSRGVCSPRTGEIEPDTLSTRPLELGVCGSGSFSMSSSTDVNIAC